MFCHLIFLKRFFKVNIKKRNRIKKCIMFMNKSVNDPNTGDIIKFFHYECANFIFGSFRKNRVILFIILLIIEKKYPYMPIPKEALKSSFKTNTGAFLVNNLIMSILSLSSLVLVASNYSQYGLLGDMPDGPLHVQELDGKMIAAGAKAVVQDKGAHAPAVQPSGHLRPFMIRSQTAIAAARADHKGRTVRLVLRSRPDQQKGLILVRIPPRSRSPLRPKAHLGGFRKGGRQGQQEKARKGELDHKPTNKQ